MEDPYQQTMQYKHNALTFLTVGGSGINSKDSPIRQGLSRYLETGCPNRGFIDFCVSKVWYKIHTTNKIDPIPLQILLFRPDTALCVL